MVRWFLALVILSLVAPVVQFGQQLSAVDDGGCVFFRESLCLGSPIVISSEHSLERSVMEDQLVLCDGMLWIWSTAVRTYNAGIPTEAPLGGVFIRRGDWDVLLGGRRPVPTPLRYRVGDEFIGKNRVVLHGKEIDLFKVAPKRVLSLTIEPVDVSSGND